MATALPLQFDKLRVLLLGKTGSGKSSLGNILLGKEKYFDVSRGMSSGTQKCSWAEVQRAKFRLRITDTPGLCDTHREQEEIVYEIAKCIGLCAPGPQVVLFVFRCDKRFTQEEYDAYITLKKLFGEEICKHMIAVFAGVDVLCDKIEEQQEALRQELENGADKLKQILHDAEWRIFAVNNRVDQVGKERQAQQLFDIISKLMQKNKGKIFSNRMCEDIGTQVQALVESRMKKDGCSRDVAEERVIDSLMAEKDKDFRGVLERYLKQMTALNHLCNVI